MDTIDYYHPETVTAIVGRGIGRGARVVQTVTPDIINPVQAGAGVSLLWGGIVALRNRRKYKLGKMSKRNAVLDTAGESVGMGVAAGIGLLASNVVVRGGLLLASTSTLAPFLAGVIVTTSVKVLWDCKAGRHWKCVKPDTCRSEPTIAAVKDGTIRDQGNGRPEHEEV